ncbi:hypothetical protein [Hyphomicrobium sp. LHD-15]|uniref:hypothetical protein n=1 Tax=Hyphomicrobium sp. LHD-15 TaxID=3072142 RepID=UPI00280FFF19|nr:hypothetical protein [Hyphomicrobium sp. LHD-15]MDQ8697295.1 hypothetical protein [Hyphomicrobium sp. LHD-15]
MKDGNKESAKELLSTYRTLFAINVSGIFLVANWVVRGEVVPITTWLFWAGIGCWILSSVMMTYLFLLVVPKLANEENAIIFQRPVLATARWSFLAFALGYGALMLSVVPKPA